MLFKNPALWLDWEIVLRQRSWQLWGSPMNFPSFREHGLALPEVQYLKTVASYISLVLWSVMFVKLVNTHLFNHAGSQSPTHFLKPIPDTLSHSLFHWKTAFIKDISDLKVARCNSKSSVLIFLGLLTASDTAKDPLFLYLLLFCLVLRTPHSYFYS